MQGFSQTGKERHQARQRAIRSVIVLVLVFVLQGVATLGTSRSAIPQSRRLFRQRASQTFGAKGVLAGVERNRIPVEIAADLAAQFVLQIAQVDVEMVLSREGSRYPGVFRVFRVHFGASKQGLAKKEDCRAATTTTCYKKDDEDGQKDDLLIDERPGHGRRRVSFPWRRAMSADRASRPDLKFGWEAIPMYNSRLSYAVFSYSGHLKSVSIHTR
jgi:hypothetical protein